MSQAINIHQSRGPQRDKPRREMRRRVRVRFREGAKQTVIASQLLRADNAGPDGAVELLAYESDVPRIQALVESDGDGVARAEAAHRRELRKHIAENATGGRVEDVPADRSEWTDDMRKAESVYGGSVEGEFYRLSGRGILPLVEVIVDDEQLDPPLGEHEESVAAVAKRFAGGGMDADALAAAMATAMERVLRSAGVIDAPGGKTTKGK